MRMNKKTIIAIVLCIGVFFMAVGYSILKTELTITGGANITSTWDVRITGITNTDTVGSAYNIEEPSYTTDTAKFKVALVNPGDSMTYNVTIENKGTLTAILNGMDITTSGTDAIIYEVSGLKDGDTIAASETKTLTVTARYNSNVIADPTERYKTLKVGLDWIQYTNQTIPAGTYTVSYHSNGGTGSMSDTTCTVGSDCVLSSNTFTKDGYTFTGWAISATGAYVYTDGATVKNLTSSGKRVTLYAVWKETNTLVANILKTNELHDGTTISSSDTAGLYYTSTNTEDNKTTYFFRGSVTNHLVSFAGQTWRIVRINEDGSVRLILSSSIGKSVYNDKITSMASNSHVGYMFGTETSPTYSVAHANTTSSTIKDLLDGWYADNLSSFSSYIADAGFCNDRTVASGYGVGNMATTYAGTKQFVCQNAENDLFTTSASSKGNKALSVPIGLITAGEYHYATTSSSSLTSLIGVWTMTPSGFNSSAKVYAVGGTMIAGTTVSSSLEVLPVINLNADVEISTGDGTSGNPYVIKTS